MTASIPSHKTGENKISSENKKEIENHKRIANYLEAAATCHLNAAAYHGAGNIKQAYKSTITARGYTELAIEVQEDIIKNNLLKNIV